MVKVQFYAFTKYNRPGLHISDKRHAAAHTRLSEAIPLDSHPGWWRFDVNLPEARTIRFKLFNWNEPGTNESSWEDLERVLPVKIGGDLPEQVWFVEGSSRIILQDPFSQSNRTRIIIHCITKEKYKNGELYIWTPLREDKPLLKCSGTDDYGCFYDFEPDEDFGNIFNFVFIQPSGTYEQKWANRTWVVTDGGEIWTHSEGPDILTARPLKKDLTIHFRHELGDLPVFMHIWQDGHGFREYEEATPGPAPGWLTFQRAGSKNLYTRITYGIIFTTRKDSPQNLDWEDNEARRYIILTDNETYWTLEGDSKLFTAMPEQTQPVMVEIAAKEPGNWQSGIDTIEVKINKARAALPAKAEQKPDGTWLFWTYPGVVTFFKFGTANPMMMENDYHRIVTSETAPNPRPEIKVYVILDRPPVLFEKPPVERFQNPPFWIQRPGVVEDKTGQNLQFAFHAPWCARVRLWGDWLPTGSEPVDLKSTEDGTFWWLELPVNEIRASLPEEYENDYHGARYHYILNEITHDKAHNELNGGKIVQDPAADWVETSNIDGFSKMVNHKRYLWKSKDYWRTPGWEYLLLYQLHPSRFTNRHLELPPLSRIAREVESGYLKDLGVTAILLMPVSEFQGSNSWGYAPSYFYAVEESYGGPDKLKELIDTCHQNGIAVLLDVVFNHLGCGDNIIWATCRDTFVNGDTEWGPLPNFNNDQCQYFFTQNLVNWVCKYHVDGFRFDQTKPIINGEHYAPFIRKPGDGGGWEFLHTLRHAVKSVEPLTLFMAEELPNDWTVTNYGGPMDTQWDGDFHHRMVDLSKGFGDQIGQFAEAQQYSQTACQQWYNPTIYSESHDEVGNVNDRIANVAGFGQGLRRNKVAATATLLSRGVPMFFMGEEYGETDQFFQNSDQPLDLNFYETGDPEEPKKRVHEWWKALINLRKNNPKIQGPSPINIHFADDQILAFSRGESSDFFIICNFGYQATSRNLGTLNLPDGLYKELLNSTWGNYRVQAEKEYEHSNGGWDARLHRGYDVNIPDYGAVILERV